MTPAMSTEGLLAGKRALVTGAARGQGRAIVEAFVAAGATVLATDVEVTELEGWASRLEPRVFSSSLDVTSEVGWREAVESARSHLGGLDVLVNNAGLLRRKPLVEEAAEDFEAMWRVNCLGPFLGMKACAPLLAKGNDPSVVNTESVAAAAAFPNHVSYGSSKWALRGLTRFAALDLSAMGIRVNAVLPGPIATPMMLAGDDSDAEVRARFATLPLGRMGEAREVASVVAFLASDLASYVTGSEFVVDGGQLTGPAPG
jgi:NAD(P)-dependent dehydrogenase (short-subunit alcohol dehydrogenase family)